MRKLKSQQRCKMKYHDLFLYPFMKTNKKTFGICWQSSDIHCYHSQQKCWSPKIFLQMIWHCKISKVKTAVDMSGCQLKCHITTFQPFLPPNCPVCLMHAQDMKWKLCLPRDNVKPNVPADYFGQTHISNSCFSFLLDIM